MQLDLTQLRELLADIDKTNISELTLKSTDFELTVRKGGSLDRPLSSVDVALTGRGLGTDWVSSSPPVPAGGDRTSQPIATGPAQAPAPAPTPPSPDPKWVEVTSPMVGTFYRSPAPDEAPFVSEGDRIACGQTVCIIEAMKLMNEIEAEVSGRVVEVLIENGAPVEFGQPLMRIDPD